MQLDNSRIDPAAASTVKSIADTLAAEIGIKAFAYKPVVTADLAKMVRTVLDKAKENRTKT